MQIRYPALLLLLALPAPLYAQSSDGPFNLTPEDLTVQDRVQQEFQQVGGRIGPFFLYPELTAELGVSDNVLARETSEIGDELVNMQAAVRLVSVPGPDRYIFRGYYARDFHSDLTGEDADRFGVTGYARIGSVKENFLEFEGGAENLIVPRENIDDVPEADSPISFGRFHARAAIVNNGRRWSTKFEANADARSYQDATSRAGATIDQDYRDRQTYGLRGLLRYSLNEEMGLVMRGSADRIEYTFGQEDAAFDPTSDIDRDSWRWNAEAGFGVQLQDVLYLDLTAGYGERSYDDQPLQPINVGGFSISANMLWNPSEASTVEFLAERTYDESASTTIAGYQVSLGRLRLSQVIAKNLLVRATLRAALYEPNGGTIDRLEYGAAFEAEYYFDRRFSLIAEYFNANRSSDDPAVEFSSNRVQLGVRARF